ncbi:glycosyltransferase 87 family protein [Chlamydiota bacterium]
MLIAAGSISLILWGIITVVSRGIPLPVMKFLLQINPSWFHAEIQRMGNGFFYGVSNKDMPAAAFFIIFTLIFCFYIASILFLKKTKKSYIFVILFFSIVFRLILIPSTLIHENDMYRYIWDGKICVSGINPYKYPPQTALKKEIEAISEQIPLDHQKKLVTLRTDNPRFYERIGYKKVSTIYPPVSQLVFALGSFLKKDSILIMKILFVLFDVLTILVLIRLLNLLKMNKNMVIVYAWSPLILKEFANSGHGDAIALFFVCLACLCVVLNKNICSAIFFGLGILSKLFPIVLIPFFYKRVRKLSFLIVLFSVLIGSYLPFIMWNNTAFSAIFSGFFVYAKKWSFNGGIFEFIYSVFSVLFANKQVPYFLSKISVYLIFISIMVVLLTRLKKRENDFLATLLFALMWLFLLSPVGDPWYYTWIIPFLCFFPLISGIFLSWLLILSYVTFTRDLGSISIGNYTISTIILVQYIPFYFVFIFEMLLKKRASNQCLIPAKSV